MTSREIRPKIKDLIKVGHSESGAKYELVNAKQALAALAQSRKR